MQTLSYGPGREEEVGSLVLAEPYRIGRQIGRSTLAVVCEAAHLRLPGRFAVKVLAREFRADAAAVAQFCREGEILSQLRHPNVVQLLDFNSTQDGLPYFVMEYLDGTDLGRRLETGDPMLPAWTVHIVDQVASALAAAHARGILHRELTPASIFLTRIEGQDDEFVKVLDLGMRGSTKPRSEDATSRTSRPSAPRYRAPEQALGQTERIDGRTDQFALAAITYAMLSGRDAFAGDDPAALLYQVVHEQPPPLSRLLSWDASRVQTVISRGLAKDQDMRYESVLDFARALEGAVFHTGAAFPMVAPAPTDVAAVMIPNGAPPVTLARSPAVLSTERQAAVVPIPLRLPPARSPVTAPGPKHAISAAKRRSVLAEGDEVDVAGEVDPPGAARTSRRMDAQYDWELPSTIDRVPISPMRAVALVVMAAALTGVLVGKGWHRELPADLSFFRENAVAFFRPTAPLPQPEAAPTRQAMAPAPAPVPLTPAPPAAAEARSAEGEVAEQPAAERPTPPAVRQTARPRDDQPPAKPASRPRSRSAVGHEETRRSPVQLLPFAGEATPRTSPPAAVPPSPSAALPSPSTMPASPSIATPPSPSATAPTSPKGFSIAPPASQPLPDDILPMGADGTPASAEGSEGRRAPPPPPAGTPARP